MLDDEIKKNELKKNPSKLLKLWLISKTHSL